jgi:hypothetical protein
VSDLARRRKVAKRLAACSPPVDEASLVADKLIGPGGEAETRAVSDEDLEEAHTAATTDEP